MKYDRILVINPFGIGDVLFTTPLLRHLRRRFPGSFIGFICNSRTAPLLSSNKNLNEIFVFDKGDFRALWRFSKIRCIRQFFEFLKIIKARKFDIAIDLSLGHQYSFFLKVLAVPVRAGYNFKNRGRFLTHKIDIDGYHNKHITDYYLDILDLLGVPAARGDDNLEIFIPREATAWAENFLKDNGVKETDKVLAIAPGGGASWGKTAVYKQWPAPNFAAVADEIINKYSAKVLILGGAGDLSVCETVLKAMRNKPVYACGKTNILQFAALIKQSSLVICNDGGPLHIAVAAGAKTVSLFGPVDERVYGPYPLDKRHIVLKGDISCRPCYKGFRFNQCDNRQCLSKITPADVVKAVQELYEN